MEACDGDADEGYTADYTPVLAANLADTYETDLIEGTDADYIGDKTSYVDCSLYQGEDDVLASSKQSLIDPLSWFVPVGWLIGCLIVCLVGRLTQFSIRSHSGGCEFKDRFPHN